MFDGHSDRLRVAAFDYISEMMQESRCRNSAGLLWWRGSKAMRRWGGSARFSGGRTGFSLPRTAHKDAGDGFLRQNTMPRRLRAHPTRQRGKKRVESLREGEGEEGNYASIGLHWIRQSPNSSGFSLRCNRVNGLEISEAATVRTRTDISILSAFSLSVSHRIRTRWPCLHCACRIKGDVSGEKLALLWADGRIGRVSLGWSTKRGPWSLKRPTTRYLLTRITVHNR